jgi:hypothetical protein
MSKGDCSDGDCEDEHCFRCSPPEDWGITSGEWEELTSYQGSVWRDKLREWDRNGRPGSRPGVAHTEWGLDGRPYHVDENGHIERGGGCAVM